MAVKVMVAPAIARGGVGDAGAGRATVRMQAGQAAKAPRARRRSSVYDADGNEVLITLMCLKCRKIRPLSQFGLRRMSDGSIRNQPWCRPCRSAPSAGAAAETRQGEAAEAGESAVPGESPAMAAPAAPAPAHRRPASVAAEIAAALAAGRR